VLTDELGRVEHFEVPSLRVLSQVLSGVQGQLEQALEELNLRNANEVLEHQLLGEQPADVAQLQHLVARGVDEIAVAVVDDDEAGVNAVLDKLRHRFQRIALRQCDYGSAMKSCGDRPGDLARGDLPRIDHVDLEICEVPRVARG
jgi:hypothetical protein